MSEAPAAPDAPAADTAPVPPAPPKRKRRLVLKILLGLFAAFLLFVLFLPNLLSTDMVRSRVESAVATSTGTGFRLGGMTVTWSGTRLDGIVFGAEGDLFSLKVASVEANPEIGAALGGDYRIPSLVVKGPEVRLDLRPGAKLPGSGAGGGSGGSGGGKGGGGGAKDDTVPPFQVHLEVVDGTLVVVTADGVEHRVGAFSFSVDAGRDTEASLKGKFTPPGGGAVEFQAKTTPFSGGKPVAPDALVAEATVRLAALDLGALAPLLRSFVDLKEVAGVVDADVSVRTGDGVRAAATVDLTAKGLRATGPVLGDGATLSEPALRLKGTFTADTAGSLEARDVELKAAGIDLKGTLNRAADGALTGSLSGKGSLQPLADRARAMGMAAEGVIMGDFVVDALATSGQDAQRLSGTFTVTDLQVSPGPTRAAVIEPRVGLVFDFIGSGDRWTVDGTSVKSSFLDVALSGTASSTGDMDLKARGAARLGPVLGIARALGLAPPGDISGDAGLEVSVRRTGDDGEARGTLEFHDLVVTPPGDGAKPVRESLVKVAFEAAPGKERIAVRSLSVTSGFVQLTARGDLAATGVDGGLDSELAVEIAPALAVARGLGVELPVGLRGSVAWKGRTSWTETGAAVVAKGTVTGKDLVATLPAEEGAQPVEIAEAAPVVDVHLSRDAAGLLTLEAVSARVSGAKVDVKGTVDAEGRLDLALAGAVDIETALRHGRAMGHVTGKRATPGSVEFDLGLKGLPAEPAVALRSVRTRDADFDLAASGSFVTGGAIAGTVTLSGDLARVQAFLEGGGWMEPQGPLAGAAKFTVTADAADASAPVKAVVKGEVTGLSVNDPSGGPPWTQKRVGIDVDVVADRVKETVLGRVDLTLDDGTAGLEGSGKYTTGARTMDLKAALDLDLAGLIAARPSLMPVEGASLGRLKGNVALRGPLREPLDLVALDGEGTVTLDFLKAEAFRAEAVELGVLLQQGSVATRTLKATLNEGTVGGRAIFALDGPVRKHLLELDVAGVKLDNDLAGLLARVVPLFLVQDGGRVSGTVDMKVKLEAEGVDWKESKRSLVGEGTMAVRDGSVVGGGIIGGLAEVLGGGSSLQFTSLETAFSVRDRRVWNDRLVVDSEEKPMLLKGSTHFNGSLDYGISAKALKMGPKKRERLAPILDADGNLPFRLGGTMDSPELEPPDMKKLLGGKVDDLLKKGLGGLLGGDDEDPPKKK